MRSDLLCCVGRMDRKLKTPAGLPLIDALSGHYEGCRGLLTGWRCIYVQHILESNRACLRFLEGMGLARQDTMVFGKAYSSSATVLARLRREGWRVWEPPGYTYERAFDDLIIDAISVWMRDESRADRPLLVVDEGGLASRALAASEEPKGRLAIVELTSRGAQHYAGVSTLAPVVDVARSAAKKQIESKYIAASMAQALSALVPKLLLPGGMVRVGLVGAGAIGSALLNEMNSRRIAVETFDQDPSKGDVGDIVDLVKSCEVVLSSTGGGVDWTKPLQSRIGERILVNCGSSDVEFSPWRLRRLTAERGGEFNIQHPLLPWRGDVDISHGGNRFRLLRGGFPVNFDNSDDPIPSETIQLTRAVLMAGAIQAVCAKSVGVIPLSENIQAWILRQYNELRAAGPGGRC